MQSTIRSLHREPQTEASTSEQQQSRSAPRASHWAVLLLALALTVVGSVIARKEAHRNADAQFDQAMDDAIDKVQFRMAKYETALLAAVASLHATPQRPTREQWRALANTMQIDRKYPGIDGIGLALAVSRAALAEHTETMRVELPDYEIQTDLERDLTLPIVHVEPLAGNERAIGLDMMREAARRTAVNHARELRTTQITAPIRLINGTNGEYGFLLFVPIFNSDMFAQWDADADAFIGVVCAPFDAGELLVGALGRDQRDVLIRLSDQGKPLFDELGGTEIDQQRFATRTIPMLGREWEFEFLSDAFNANTGTSNAILVAGLLIDGILLIMFLTLGKANRQANERVVTATESLCKANVALTNANANLENFSHAATIALRGPIRGILGLTDWIREDIAALSGGEWTEKLQPTKDNVNTITDRAQRMNDLLNGLLTYAGAGEQPGEPELISVSALRNEICENVQLPPSQPSLETSIEFLTVDRERLVQVLHELIDNAVRHHHQPEMLRLALHVSEQSDHYLLEVEDNGPGIDTADLETVFEAFHVNTNRGNSRACGLGLAIARKLAQSVDGAVTAREAEHGGTIMSVRWPKPARSTFSMEAA